MGENWEGGICTGSSESMKGRTWGWDQGRHQRAVAASRGAGGRLVVTLLQSAGFLAFALAALKAILTEVVDSASLAVATLRGQIG